MFNKLLMVQTLLERRNFMLNIAQTKTRNTFFRSRARRVIRPCRTTLNQTLKCELFIQLLHAVSVQ